MNRIEARFAALRDKKRKALVPYVTAGDPNPQVTVPMLHAMVQAGADVIELGVPFSDPMADGPVIQRASERALAHKMTLRRVLDLVREFRKTDRDTPVVLMGYLNPFEAMGYGTFAALAAQAGVDGVLTVDMPPEESGDFAAELRKNDLAPIYLIAPTTPPDRIASICAQARGFVYYVSLKGVTGAAHLDVAAVAEKLKQIRGVTSLPVGVGFGIRDAQSAAAVARIADAVVVGSAIVRRIEESDVANATGAVQALLRDMRAAMDRG
jgi:tryptophan synthase alpha chain